jgi:prophage regulatory protein
VRRILRRREVSDRTGLGRSTLYAYMQDGRFPRAIKLGPRAVGWLEDEIEKWIAERVAERDRITDEACLEFGDQSTFTSDE